MFRKLLGSSGKKKSKERGTSGGGSTTSHGRLRLGRRRSSTTAAAAAAAAANDNPTASAEGSAGVETAPPLLVPEAPAPAPAGGDDDLNNNNNSNDEEDVVMNENEADIDVRGGEGDDEEGTPPKQQSSRKGKGGKKPPPSLPPEEDIKLEQDIVACFKSMRKSPSNVTKQRKALGKLRQYCNDNSSVAADRAVYLILQPPDGFALIATAMQKFRKMAALQNHACRVVALLARVEPKTTMTALPAVLEAMTSHGKRNANLVCNGLSALSFWGMHKDEEEENDDQQQEEEESTSLALKVVNQGAYPIIFQVMTTTGHESNSTVIDKALKTLLILVSTNNPKECRTAFVSAKAWKALGGCMRTFLKKSKIQLKGLKILRYITMDHPSPVSKRIYLCLNAMKNHLDDAQLQRTGCAILLSLATNHPPSIPILANGNNNFSSSTTSSSSSSSNAFCGRDAILAAMQYHSSNEDIQKTAILCLQKLPNNYNHQDTGGDDHPSTSPTSNNNNSQQQPQQQSQNDAIAQGLETMMKTLLKEDSKPQTCINICKGIIKLAMESHTNKLDIANANAIVAIIAAMKRYPQEVSLQRYGCQALGQLASGLEATRRTICQDIPDGVPTIATALSTHSSNSNPIVAMHGVLIVLKLSQLLDNHKILLEAPIVPPILLAMRHHPNHKALQHKGMLILQKLSLRYNKAKLPMIQCGSLAIILKAMTSHNDDVMLQKLGCQCILNLHHRSTTRTIVQQHPSLQIIVAAMKRHLSKIGIQLIGLRTIVEITTYASHLQYWACHRNIQGIHHLILSLHHHKEHAILYEMGFGLIVKSSATPAVRHLLVQPGPANSVLPIVMEGMKIHHPAHPIIQQTGFKTLYNLSIYGTRDSFVSKSRRNSWRNGAIIFKRGGWRVVRHAQTACPDDPIIQKHAWTLMMYLLVVFVWHWMTWLMYHVLNLIP